MFLVDIFFHISEYHLAIAISNVTLRSLLIDKRYIILSEYFLELLLIPQVREFWWISNLGLAMVVVGEIIRVTAIITAAKAFTLVIIRTRRDERHKLVTQGIYKYVRNLGSWYPVCVLIRDFAML
ncbi:protein-S-isoprenylcysteine O-methyltransferase B [Morus notabilis]|uniref:protein-S-isoprenylcysteine O-methyltransferase B n=1 Tax=Morus notabilis TaxID=981085 RepID=UPI000CED0B80|nr:protein-S-isoprenylcysteine O-methyltransferase B [Morus notabilis]